MPGMLPVINAFCVEQAVKTGLGLKAKINTFLALRPEELFLPGPAAGLSDLPVQIDPIVGEGEIDVDAGQGGYTFTVGIERLHLEQDAGKSIHDLDPKLTYVDLNRSGVALMEIVSRPDIRSPAEAAAYVKKLRSILIALGTCDGDMEKGNLRADVNVSVCRPGGYDHYKKTGSFEKLGTRCEIKNVNSFRFIQQAIEYEARRQIEILEDGGKIDQETRLYDAGQGRDALHALEGRRARLPLLPRSRSSAARTLGRVLDRKHPGQTARTARPEARPLREGLRPQGIRRRRLASDAEKAAYFEAVAKGRDARLAANWVTQDLFGYLNKEGLELSQSPIKADQLGGLIGLIADNTISGKIAKDVFLKMIATGDAATAIVEREGLKQVTDTGAIEKVIDEVIAANPKQVQEIADQRAAGHEKPKTLGWLVGQIMKASGGKVNPAAVNEILLKKLGL
jgi:aspartyl-tRNA(Asn)/glutamyl-tRNA(Gln) amidotransferase subunit B